MMTRSISLLCLAIVATACTDDVPHLPPQNWKNITITVETRPPVLAKGMNEFLIITSDDQRRPVHDLIVTLQIRGHEKRHQAIQDGHVGAYRRAVPVQDPANDVLIVKLQRGEESGLLEFPLGEQTAP
ncbi:MAG: hypothetical protein FD130_887 [Halothiobacillaceae bacterium]|nr:MAG: hypothetical protein FD130_887 [Halothiobacillaceae bacterium]